MQAYNPYENDGWDDADDFDLVRAVTSMLAHIPGALALTCMNIWFDHVLLPHEVPF